MEQWRITVRNPDGEEVAIELSSDQIMYFIGGHKDMPFTTALWLAYTDMWMQEGE